MLEYLFAFVMVCGVVSALAARLGPRKPDTCMKMCVTPCQQRRCPRWGDNTVVQEVRPPRPWTSPPTGWYNRVWSSCRCCAVANEDEEANQTGSRLVADSPTCGSNNARGSEEPCELIRAMREDQQCFIEIPEILERAASMESLTQQMEKHIDLKNFNKTNRCASSSRQESFAMPIIVGYIEDK